MKDIYKQLRQFIKEELVRITEAEVVDMFSSDQKKENAMK